MVARLDGIVKQESRLEIILSRTFFKKFYLKLIAKCSMIMASKKVSLKIRLMALIKDLSI